MVYIYALVDPFSKQIRYIGKSVRPKERLVNHCNEKSVTYRTNWIRKVLARGGRPEIAILETLSDKADWASAEREWIAHGWKQGWLLTNCTSGGDGVRDLPPEIRRRISQTWIGRKHKPESLIKIGNASKGRKHTESYKRLMRRKMKGRKITWGAKISKAISKLSDGEVRAIRKLLNDKISQYVIAERFSVHQGTISNIKRGLVYQWVK